MNAFLGLMANLTGLKPNDIVVAGGVRLKWPRKKLLLRGEGFTPAAEAAKDAKQLPQR
jgi:hypothetical protein